MTDFGRCFKEMMDFLSNEFPSYFGHIGLKQRNFCCNAGLAFLTRFGRFLDPIDESLLIDENRVMVYYDEDLEPMLKRHMPIWYDYWLNKIHKINKNIHFGHYVLAHELGHYLDYLDNPDKMIEDCESDFKIKKYLNELERFGSLDAEFHQALYCTELLSEVRANKNAIKLLKSMNKLGYWD